MKVLRRGLLIRDARGIEAAMRFLLHWDMLSDLLSLRCMRRPWLRTPPKMRGEICAGPGRILQRRVHFVAWRCVDAGGQFSIACAARRFLLALRRNTAALEIEAQSCKPRSRRAEALTMSCLWHNGALSWDRLSPAAHAAILLGIPAREAQEWGKA